MKGIKYDDFAVIFQIKTYYNGTTECVPVDVKTGTYDNDSKRFIDESGQCYLHIIETSSGFGFFNCSDIESGIKDYKNLPLLVVKKIILNNYKKSTYQYVEDIKTEAPIILVKNKHQKITPLIDSYMFLYYAEYYAEFFQKYFKMKASTVLENIYNDDSLKKRDDSDDLTNHLKESKENVSPIDAKNLYNELTKRVVGQDEPIKDIVVALWKQYGNNHSEESRNILINGRTGSGKTAIFRALSQLTDIPTIIVDITRYSATGYVGKDIEDMIIQLLVKTNGDVEKAQHGILIIDEIDKLSSKNNHSDVNTTDVQIGLLKLLEDGIFTVNFNNHYIEFDTSNLLIIAGGSWSNITSLQKKAIGFNNIYQNNDNPKLTKKDFEENGMMPEFLGRFPITIQLNNLSQKDYVSILNNPYGILAKNIKFFESKGVKLIFTEDAISEIANISFQSIFGVRALDEIVELALAKASFEIASNPRIYEKLIITKDTISDNSNYELIKLQTSCKKKAKKIESKDMTNK